MRNHVLEYLPIFFPSLISLSVLILATAELPRIVVLIEAIITSIFCALRPRIT